MATLPTYEMLLKASHGDLLTLQANVTKAIAETEHTNRKSAISELQNRARELGFDLHSLLNDASAKGKGKGASEPKYKDANSATTWTGRGRKPQFVSDHLASGGNLDDLLIK